ncbi:uncharacterized protein [Panulirus ornatus]|uniref:uncharacterized protein n=1 Tax=Panulirus ornatus TaxID=150431 RepID=UPI003A86B0E0
MKVLLVLSVVVAVATPGTVHGGGGGGVHRGGIFVSHGLPSSAGGGNVLHGLGVSHRVPVSHDIGPVSHVGPSYGGDGGAVVSVGSGVPHGNVVLSHDIPLSIHDGNVFSFHDGPVDEVVHSASAPVVVHSGVGGDKVDLSTSYSDYHFSWLHDGASKYTWDNAIHYCKSLEGGWQGVSIETDVESQVINEVVAYHNLKYIWTGGHKRGSDWAWTSGNPFIGLNWSQTGSKHIPQPDNNEGNENCLAVLNHFYQYDGITWHDIACRHLKPIICERPLHYSDYR